MGKRGPPKTPTHILKAVGSWRADEREAKRLGSFPDDYHAKTDKIGKYMIGMSVPPRMTEAVARAVITQWIQPSSPASSGQHPDMPSDPSQ